MNSETKIQELEAKVEELTALVEQMASARTPNVVAASITEEAEPTRSSRRGMLKLAGAAAVGAAAAAATGALPAAATNGINIADPTLAVRNDYTGNVAQAAFLFQAGSQFANGAAAFDCALAGWSGTGGSNLPHGVYGYTNNGGFGVVGSGEGSSSGVLARGSRSNMQLTSAGTAAPTRTIAYLKGDIINDVDGDLWFCVAAGTPGTWRKLAGPSTAGSLQLLAAPKRVYSSRAADEPVAVGPKTPLSAGTRTIDCKQGSSGVPAGATGLVLNVTAIAGSVNGYLSVSPGASGFSGTSTLNWTANGAVVANGVTVGAGAGATIDVTIGGGGTADFIVDVMGFYA
ncbi:MAG: hypothetical protein NTZ21_04445 [Actinobacteria bacterium]|nr:hypothetical protein [Actinomycetota bacterium]